MEEWEVGCWEPRLGVNANRDGLDPDLIVTILPCTKDNLGERSFICRNPRFTEAPILSRGSGKRKWKDLGVAFVVIPISKVGGCANCTGGHWPDSRETHLNFEGSRAVMRVKMTPYVIGWFLAQRWRVLRTSRRTQKCQWRLRKMGKTRGVLINQK